MTNKITKGDTVRWNYGKGKAMGEIQGCKTARTTIKSKGKQIVRNGSKDNPAYILQQKDKKTKVLKLKSELTKD